MREAGQDQPPLYLTLPGQDVSMKTSLRVERRLGSVAHNHRPRLMLAAAIGDCVHVAGLHVVIRIAREAGFETIMLGPAVAPERVVDAIREHDPEVGRAACRERREGAAGDAAS